MPEYSPYGVTPTTGRKRGSPHSSLIEIERLPGLIKPASCKAEPTQQEASLPRLLAQPNVKLCRVLAEFFNQFPATPGNAPRIPLALCI